MLLNSPPVPELSSFLSSCDSVGICCCCSSFLSGMVAVSRLFCCQGAKKWYAGAIALAQRDVICSAMTMTTSRQWVGLECRVSSFGHGCDVSGDVGLDGGSQGLTFRTSSMNTKDERLRTQLILCRYCKMCSISCRKMHGKGSIACSRQFGYNLPSRQCSETPSISRVVMAQGMIL